MRVEGYLGGFVEFDGQFVTIGRKGVARMVAGGGTKRLHISGIGAIQIKPAGVMTNGFIQFAVAGSPELRSRLGHRTLEAGRDENSVIFTRSQQRAFEHLRGVIEHAQAALRTPQAPPPPQPVDVAGQIAQMWQLVQAGAMTRHEFEMQKARLLGTPIPPRGPVGPPPPHGFR
jgi:hypothetical protein